MLDFNPTFEDRSSGDFPKTLLIHNSRGGAIWQIYHVKSMNEADIITQGAHKYGYEYVSLEDHQPDQKETFPDWRSEVDWAE